MLSAGLNITNFGIRGGVTDVADGSSQAALLLGSETNGLAISFIDMSMVIRDTTTPANNYSGSVGGKISYSAAKNIVGSDGLIKAVTGFSSAFSGSTNIGQWIERATTNLFVNPRSPATQNVTVSAQPYTLTFYGTGSIVLSGTATATVNGSGVTTRSRLTFTPTAGTLTLTCSGSLDYVQLETGSWPTSFFSGSRASHDIITLATSLFPYNAAEGIVRVSGYLNSDVDSTTANYWWSLSDGTISNTIHAVDLSGNRAQIAAGGVPQFDNIVAPESVTDVINTIAMAYKANSSIVAANGVIGTLDTVVTIPSGINILRLGARGDNNSATALDGTLTSFLYLPRRPTDVEVQAMSLSTYTPAS